jgi:hypothetical protein
MKNKSLRIKILSGMLCTGLTLSSASFSFAAVSPNSVNEKPSTSMDFRPSVDAKKVEAEKRIEMKATLEAVIKDSVRLNIITATEGEKVLEYVTTKVEKKCEEGKKCKREKSDHTKGGLFKGLVTDGILTKEKSDALREKLYDKKAEIRTGELQKGLNTLVENKVLTIEQSNKVIEAITARDAERKEDYKKMKDMSEKERKSHMKKMKCSKVNPMKALLDNGTITKEQEKEIQKLMHHHHHHDGNHDSK